MIQIYRQDNIDYRHNGDMTLLPEEAIIHVILNGEWTANIEHPIDLEGRWKYIEENAVVKMPSFNGIQLFRIRSKEKKDSGVSAELTPIFMDAKEDCFLVDVRPTNKSGQEALDVMTEKTPQYQAKSDIKKVSTAYVSWNIGIRDRFRAHSRADPGGRPVKTRKPYRNVTWEWSAGCCFTERIRWNYRRTDRRSDRKRDSCAWIL